MLGITIARFFIVFFSFLLFAFAIGLLVSGITVHLKNFAMIDRSNTNYADILHVIEAPDDVDSAAICVITAGAVSLFFSIFGCCTTVLCTVYGRYTFLVLWIVLLLLVVFEISVIIYFNVNPDKRNPELREKTYDSLKKHFKPVSQLDDVTWKNLANFHSVDSVQDSWLMMEMRFNCCGANDFQDYQTFPWNKHIIISGRNVTAVVPVQCCKQLHDGFVEKNVTQCLRAQPMHFNPEGCSDVVASAVGVFFGYVTGLLVGGIGIQIVLICAAIYIWTKFQW